MTMKPEIKARWCAKLREDDRTQAFNMLRDATGAQCCLDVLNEIGVEDGIVPEPILNLNYYKGPAYGYETNGPLENPSADGREYNLITIEVAVYAGLIDEKSERLIFNITSQDPIVYIVENGNKVQVGLSYLNDAKRMSLKEIADVIEESEL